MKKWVSLLMGAALAVSMPASAFATDGGVNLNNGTDVNVTVTGTATGTVKFDAKLLEQLANDEILKLGDIQKLTDELGEIREKLKIETVDGEITKLQLKIKELEDKIKDEEKIKGEIKLKLDEQLKLKKSEDIIDAIMKIDGNIDTVWALAKQKIHFKDAATGAEGNYWFTWDGDNLYCLVELEGAAKLWKEDRKAALLSLFFSGDGENGGGEGYLALSWPDMTVYHDSTLNLGSFKPNQLGKAFSVSGDNVILELKLPWVSKKGLKLTSKDKLGLCIGSTELGAKVDVNGQVVVPDITLQKILSMKPGVLELFQLDWLGTLINHGKVTLGVDTDVNTGGTGGTGTTPGSSGGGADIGSGSSGTPGGGTAVGGVSEGVVPGAMPQTGGGGASDWTN